MKRIHNDQVSASTKGRGPKEKWPFATWLKEMENLGDNEWLLLEQSDLPSKTKYPSSYIRFMMKTKHGVLVQTKNDQNGILIRLEKQRDPVLVTTTNDAPTKAPEPTSEALTQPEPAAPADEQEEIVLEEEQDQDV